MRGWLNNCTTGKFKATAKWPKPESTDTTPLHCAI
jgi:hypothetical protein